MPASTHGRPGGGVRTSARAPARPSSPPIHPRDPPPFGLRPDCQGMPGFCAHIARPCPRTVAPPCHALLPLPHSAPLARSRRPAGIPMPLFPPCPFPHCPFATAHCPYIPPFMPHCGQPGSLRRHAFSPPRSWRSRAIPDPPTNAPSPAPDQPTSSAPAPPCLADTPCCLFDRPCALPALTGAPQARAHAPPPPLDKFCRRAMPLRPALTFFLPPSLV